MKSSGFVPGIALAISLSLGCGGSNSTSQVFAGDPSGDSTPSSSSKAPAGLIPTPPVQAVTFSSVQNKNGWSSCNAQSCAGGSGTGEYWMAQNQSSPSLSGSSMELHNSGVWGDALWWNKLGANPHATNFLWDFYFQLDEASLSAAQALEFDQFQFLHGYNYMMGSQCNYASSTWDAWDEGTDHWHHTSIPCPKFQPGIWHHVELYFQRNADTSYSFITLAVDGTSYAVNETYSAKNVGWDGHVGLQHQLDVNATGQAYE
jgi:hypothetical protein